MSQAPDPVATHPDALGGSMYLGTAVPPMRASSDPLRPGTHETARIETIDNDVAALLLHAGVVR